MKKALVIFLALAMVCSAFAAEPAAEVKVAEFKGSAAVTFGVDLDAGTTGFKNETDGSLKLNLMNGGDKSTTGDGIWGELKLKIVGLEIHAKADKNYAIATQKDNDGEDNIRVEIDTAKIHFGPVYMGIKSGDLNYGGSFWYPHALNYKDSKDESDAVSLNRMPSAKLKYDQGFILGFEKKDLFKVEASLRSKKDTPKKVDKIEAYVFLEAYTIKDGDEYYANVADAIAGTPKLAVGTSHVAGTTVYKRVMKDGDTNYWTNKYAFGVYGETTPIKDLRLGLGFAYALGELGKDAKVVKDADNKNDFTLFAGADYRFNFNEDFFIQPTVTYTLYNDWVWGVDSGKYASTLKTNVLNAGLRFGFAKSKSSSDNSILYDFFGEKKLVYEVKQNDKGDDMLLPGVSVFSSFNLNKGAMKTMLPLMVTAYSGEIVKGLNAAALFYANLGPDAGKVSSLAGLDYGKLIAAKGLQAGLAASYDVMVGDITIVPAAGFLWTHSGVKVDKDNLINADEFAVETKVDVKGLVSNTTFTLFWDNAAFGVSKAKVSGTSSKTKVNKFGEIGLKAKIAL